MDILLLIAVYCIFISLILIIGKGLVNKNIIRINLLIVSVGFVIDCFVLLYAINNVSDDTIQLYFFLFLFGLLMFILGIIKFFNKDEVMVLDLLPNTYSLEIKNGYRRVINYLVVGDSKILLGKSIPGCDLKIRVYYSLNKNGYYAHAVEILEGKSLFYRFVEFSCVIFLLLTPLLFYYEYNAGIIPMEEGEEGMPLTLIFFLYSFFAFGKLSFFSKLNIKDFMYKFIYYLMNFLYYMMIILLISRVIFYFS